MPESSLTLTLPSPEECVAPAKRREFRTLSAEEWLAFVAAVYKLKEPGAGGSPSIYEQFVRLQTAERRDVMGYALYLPFYRLFLRAFERALATVAPGMSLPYWDWSQDAAAPARSLLFSERYMGGNGQGSGHCVLNGAFANWTVPKSGCLTRQFNRGDHIAPFADAERIKTIVTKAKKQEALRQFLAYAPAGAVEHGIGGTIATAGSANEPIFWLHMAFVDKVWADWQAADPKNQNAVDGLLRDQTVATLETRIPGSGHKIRDVVTTRALCYDYD